MSLQTWKDEFYPTPADEAAAEDAVAHSLQKWIGLRPENLTKHDCKLLWQDYAMVIDNEGGDALVINAKTCALCAHYLRGIDEDDCARCPLHQELGCDCDDVSEPYLRFSLVMLYLEDGPELNVDHGNPEPMIKALQRTLAAQETPHG